jgi:endonuclease/exonuclease/phosphatase family metal-dependent hydrolase
VPLILNAWGGNTLTVVMGDMNAVTGAPEIELFRDAGLVDAAALTGAPPAPTFRADDLKRRIDYIWVSPDLVPLAVTVPGSTASDHLAVVAVIGR